MPISVDAVTEWMTDFSGMRLPVAEGPCFKQRHYEQYLQPVFDRLLACPQSLASVLFLSEVLLAEMLPLGSEMELSSYLVQLFKRLWAQLNRLGGNPQLLSFNKAESALFSSGALQRSKRPDTLFSVNARTAGYGEDKHESFEAAQRDLERKRADLPEQIHGTINFVLGYAAGGAQFQWFYIPGAKSQVGTECPLSL